MAVIQQVVTDKYALYNCDVMELLPTLPTESIDFSVYSPPFPNVFAYSNDPRDMANTTTYEEAIEQYRYVVREVARLTKPGRLSAVHCMELKKGQYLQRDFPGDVIRVHEEMGFHFFSRITIWKDPWLVARRTKARFLMHKTIVEENAKAHPAGADYVVVFKRAGENKVPIPHKHGFQHPKGLDAYAGECPIPTELHEYANYKGDQRKNLLSHWIWRQYASPVWSDIRTGRLLPYQEAKGNDEEHHVCPLQLDVIDRCLTMWSNPGDTVLSAFGGVGSEVFASVVMGRKALSAELKESYFRQAVKNCAEAARIAELPELERIQKTLFDNPEPDVVVDE